MNIKAFVEEVYAKDNQVDYAFFGAFEAIKQYGKNMGYGKGKEMANKVQFVTDYGVRINFFRVQRKDFWKFSGTYDEVFALNETGESLGYCKDNEKILLALKNSI
jgi:hypothetical protein